MNPTREEVRAWVEGLENGYAVPEFARMLAAAYLKCLDRIEGPEPEQLELWSGE